MTIRNSAFLRTPEQCEKMAEDIVSEREKFIREVNGLAPELNIKFALYLEGHGKIGPDIPANLRKQVYDILIQRPDAQCPKCGSDNMDIYEDIYECKNCKDKGSLYTVDWDLKGTTEGAARIMIGALKNNKEKDAKRMPAILAFDEKLTILLIGAVQLGYMAVIREDTSLIEKAIMVDTIQDFVSVKHEGNPMYPS